jgi:hypothetical protein
MVRCAIGLLVPLAAWLSVQPALATSPFYEVITGVTSKGVTIFSIRGSASAPNAFNLQQETAGGATVPSTIRISAGLVKYYEVVVSVPVTTTSVTRIKSLQAALPAGGKLSRIFLTVKQKTTNDCEGKWKYSPAWVVKYTYPSFTVSNTGTAKITYVYQQVLNVGC